MPITVTATAGVLDETAEKQIIPRLSEALLARNGAAGNSFMTPIVVALSISCPWVASTRVAMRRPLSSSS